MKAAIGYKQQSALFRALAHPVRLHILDILAEQEACVCHLTAILGQRQPYVSQQLAMLRDAGLVTDRRDGTLIYYRLSDSCLADLLAASKIATQQVAGEELAFPGLPEGPVSGCPCPCCQGQ